MAWGLRGLGVLFFFLFEAGSYSIVLNGLELTEIHMPLPLGCWGLTVYTTTPSAYMIFNVKG